MGVCGGLVTVNKKVVTSLVSICLSNRCPFVYLSVCSVMEKKSMHGNQFVAGMGLYGY